MGLTRKQVLGLIGGAAGALAGGLPGAAAADAVGTRARPATNPVISRDVVIIGGGSAGVYTAIRLRDLGVSVVVVERHDRLGGHCETYIDPATGIPIDMGVLLFENTPQVTDLFGRFDIPLARVDFGTAETAYLDLRTGAAVDGYQPPVPLALGDYYGIITQWGALDTDYRLPDPVPDELLAPFGDFVTAHGLQSIVQTVFQFGQGIGDLLGLPALYAINTVGQGIVSNILGSSFLTQAQGDNSALYDAATSFLGDDVVLGTQVAAVDRDYAGGVRVLVNTPHGAREIRAGKLVFTPPPLPGSFVGFDLDPTEAALFGRYRTSYYFTAVARLEGLPPGLQINNIGADTTYNLPPLPGIYGITPTAAPGLWNVKYGSATPITAKQARAGIAAAIGRINAAGTYPVVLDEIVAFSSHTPYALHAPADCIAAGFYRDLYALQGHNRTYYTSAAFHSHDSARIWAGTEELLPMLVAGAQARR